MKPAYKITVNGSNITALVAERLLQLTVVDEAGVKSDRVELVLDDRDQVIDKPRTKVKMQVQIGYADRLVDKGTYVVEEVSVGGPLRRMTIRANAIGASLGSGASKERSWDDTTLGKIAKSIAGEHGWQVAISEELSSIKIEHEDQSENDLQFISRLAADNGAVAKITHERLVIAPHGQGKTVSGKPMQRVTVRAQDTTDWSATVVERGDYDGVVANFYDVESGERGEAISGEKSGNSTTLPYTYSDEDEARRAAKSKRRSLKRGKETFNIDRMPGEPTIAAETIIEASGFRRDVDGEWNVVRATHTITESGYTTSIEAEKPQKDAKSITDSEDDGEW
jgi:phage protein D